MAATAIAAKAAKVTGRDGDFTTPIGACFNDPGTCVVDAWLCGPCTSAVQMATVQKREVTPVDFLKHACCFPVFNYQTRGAMRVKYGLGIPKPIPDVVPMSCCCGIWGLYQQITEMKQHNDYPCGMIMSKEAK